MITYIQYYLIVGVLWTALADWFLRKYSSKEEGFGFKEALLNTLLWWISIYLIYKAYKQDSDEGI
jgi:hypothetical protein